MQATGWFVTHCGQNSVLETIALGVPVYVLLIDTNLLSLIPSSSICWPFGADQPSNAARLSSELNVGYELFEVRTGPYTSKPIHRLGRPPIGTIEAVRDEALAVLDKAFGEDGARKRANMKKLQEEVIGAWEEGGRARRDLHRFIATLAK